MSSLLARVARALAQAEQRSDDARCAEHRPGAPLVLAALARRHDGGDGGLGEDHEATGAEALHARNAMSSVIDRATPERAEPIRKITVAAWKRYLRPKRSSSLPHGGVVTVEARR